MVKNNSSKTVDKSTYFTFILYPESIPSDWKVQLEATGRPIAISPLHDSDKVSMDVVKSELKSKENYLNDNRYVLDSETISEIKKSIAHLKDVLDGKEIQYKKKHYHVIYIAKNPVTSDSVRKKIQKLLGNDSCSMVKTIATSVRNMYDYLTHESVDAIAKKKHVYNQSDIVLLNGFDIDRYDEMDAADKKANLHKIIDIIKVNSIPNMIELEFYIDEHGSEEGITTNVLRTVIDGKAGLLRLYFDGVYQREKRKKEDEKVKNESDLLSLNYELFESNMVLKKQIEDYKQEVFNLKKFFPVVLPDIEFDETDN